MPRIFWSSKMQAMLTASQLPNVSMFKLIPTAQDFSICLRCQHRLGVRRGSHHGSRRPTKSPQQTRHFTPGASTKQQPLSAYDATTDDGILGNVPIRYLAEEMHPSQHHRHGNEPPTKDSLGLNVLGEPAEVLILRDKKKRFEFDSAMAKLRASGPDENPASEPISSSEMLERMKAERGVIGIDEVCKNIESVKASWAAETKGGVSKISYKNLASRLQQGFTKQQLESYRNRAGKNQAADFFNLHVGFSNGTYARSSWRPAGQTAVKEGKTRAPQIMGDTPEGEGESKGEEILGNESRQKSTKKTLVREIIHQCWNMKFVLQESSLGELDIQLKSFHLRLILKHKRNLLDLMSRSYDAKVEVLPRAPIIRITSDYGNCVDMVKILNHNLENIEVATIDLDVESMSHQGSVLSRRKLDEMIQQIEEYTNTLVMPQGVSRKALLVCYLGPDDADLLETRRLIYQILRPASTQTSKLAWSKGDEASDAHPVPVIVGKRLSFLDRDQEWSRWCSPRKYGQAGGKGENGENPSSALLASPAAQALHGKLAVDTVRSFFGKPDDTSYKLCRNNSPYWTPEIEYHDSVKFGQVLFLTEFASSMADMLRKTPMKRETSPPIKPIHTRDIAFTSSKQPREFVPLVPGLVHSLERLGSLEKSEEFIQIRLSPSVDNMSLPVPVKALPDLEITISFDDEKKTTSIKSVRLVTRKEKDFLQPQNIVDLRFIREQRVYARDDSIDPRITSFVQNSNFSIWGEELLKTPLGLSLSIPALAIQPHEGFAPENYDTLLVNYTSLSLEIRSAITMPYQEPDSWPTLTYTNVEAGRIAGRRDELSLHCRRFTSKQVSSADLDPLATGIETDGLSEDDHTSILFQKTADVIAMIEQTGRENVARPGLRMPVARRWRPTIFSARKIRKVDVPITRPGYVPRGNVMVRKVITNFWARAVGEEGEGEGGDEGV